MARPPKSVEDHILAARSALLWDHPFFGVLCIQLQIVDATDDPRIDTMATDGRRLYYHEPFVMGLSKDELVFVLAHEVLHNAFEHHIRRQHREPLLWNIAADYVINGELVETKVGKMPAGGLLDAEFTGLGAEEVYRILEQQGGAAAALGAGNDPGGCGGVLDACAAGDEAAAAQLSAEMQTQVRQAANIARAKAAGTLPAGVQRLIDRLTKPKIDWRAVLRRFIDESIIRDSSWAKPNRRFLPLGHILPSTISAGVSHLVIAVDTSGSINDKILCAFVSEIDAAFNEGMIDKITVIYADARVASVDEFEAGDDLVIRPAGGGGTAFSHTFEWIAENVPDASLIVYFTDLIVSDFGEQPASPVMWAVYADSKTFDQLAPNVPFGEAVSLAVA